MFHRRDENRANLRTQMWTCLAAFLRSSFQIVENFTYFGPNRFAPGGKLEKVGEEKFQERSNRGPKINVVDYDSLLRSYGKACTLIKALESSLPHEPSGSGTFSLKLHEVILLSTSQPPPHSVPITQHTPYNTALFL